MSIPRNDAATMNALAHIADAQAGGQLLFSVRYAIAEEMLELARLRVREHLERSELWGALLDARDAGAVTL